MSESDRFRSLGHRVIDLLADHLAKMARREGPVVPWRTPEESLAAWPGDFAAGPADEDSLVRMLARVVDESHHLHHPRYVGHQVTAPLPETAIARMVGALLNNGMAVYEMGPVSTAMERRVIAWLAARLGFPAAADGVLTSGGSAGNLTALLAMRQARAGFDAWREGSTEPLAVLVGETAHYSVSRSLQIMGWGQGGAIPVAVDERLRMRPDALPAALARAERRVIGVVASAASTANGAFDPLEPIADFCAQKGLWLHVDGAHGAAAALSPRHRHLVAGIERADSVIWDAHKMMLVPALATAVLFRDAASSYQAFAQKASYLLTETDERPWWDLAARTLECTKRMIALDVYTALVARGTEHFAAYVGGCFDLAARFAEHLGGCADFEVVPPECNIVCFRLRPPGLDGPALDALQDDIRGQIVRSGELYLVRTRLPAGVFLRVTLINPATAWEDLERLVAAVRRAGAAQVD